MEAAAYLRVSTEDQNERGTIETQRQEIQRYCERHGIRLVNTYADAGVSGTVPFDQRPEGARLLEDAKAGRFSTVLVYRFDRLGRETLVSLMAVSRLMELGAKPVSITENMDVETPEGMFHATMTASFASWERAAFLKRSKDGTERLVREGAWVGGIVPYGYYVTGEGKEARLTVSEDPILGFHLSEAEVIRFIFSMAAEEGRSNVVIADQLNRLGVPTSYTKDERKMKVGESTDRGKRKAATSNKWGAGQVRRLLTNETYKGVHVYGKRSSKPNRELITREVPAIVTVELWEQAQAVMRGNYRFSRRDAKRNYLLRGLIKCRDCGQSFGGTADGRTGKVYYRCNGCGPGRLMHRGTDHPKCQAASLGGEIEEAVWSDIEAFLRNPGEVVEQLKAQRESHLGSGEEVSRRLARLTREIERKFDERRKVLEAYRKELITDEELVAERATILTEENALKSERDRLQEQAQGSERAQAELSGAEEVLVALHQRLDGEVDWETKRRLVETLVQGVEVATVKIPTGKEAHVAVRYRFHVGNEHTDAPAGTGATPSAPVPAPTTRSPATLRASPALCSTASTSTWRSPVSSKTSCSNPAKVSRVKRSGNACRQRGRCSGSVSKAAPSS